MNDCCDILIVDDEEAVCQSLADALSEEGYSSTTCTHPAEAMMLLDSQPFRVVISDISMPHASGLELLSAINARCGECKVILISGYDSRQNVSAAITQGAFDFFVKPLDLEQLLKSVSVAMKGSQSHLLHEKAAEAMRVAGQLKLVSLQSTQALVKAVEAKDPYTRRHSEQVAHYAVHFAVAMQMSPQQVESIRVAALLHDIGKIGVPDNILTKPGALSDEEFAFIRRHPALGADILNNITAFADEAGLVRHHHEAWNGRGYPDGLAGEQIPLAARLINVADSMDAMLMKRTYKDAYPVQRVLEELSRCAGRQFDPALASLAIQWCRDNPDKIIISPMAAVA